MGPLTSSPPQITGPCLPPLPSLGFPQLLGFPLCFFHSCLSGSFQILLLMESPNQTHLPKVFFGILRWVPAEAWPPQWAAQVTVPINPSLPSLPDVTSYYMFYSVCNFSFPLLITLPPSVLAILALDLFFFFLQILWHLPSSIHESKSERTACPGIVLCVSCPFSWTLWRAGKAWKEERKESWEQILNVRLSA